MVPAMPADSHRRSLDRPRAAVLFAAFVCADLSGWIQLLVTTWVLLHAASAPLLLPLFMATRSLPRLAVAPFAGALADRTNRLALYRISRSLAVVMPVGLAAAVSGVLPLVPAVLTLGALGSLVAAIDQPARRGLLWDVAGPARLVGSCSLSTAAFHSAAAMAPALAVVLAVRLGSTGALATAALIAAGAPLALWILRRLSGTEVPHRPSANVHPLGGIHYLLRTPRALALVLLTGLPGLAGRLVAITVPAVGGSHLNASLAGTSALASAPGAGAFLAAMGLAMVGDLADKPRLALACALAFPAFLLLAALSDSLYGGAVFLTLSGAAGGSFGTLISAMLHLQVPDHLRGRVLAL
jgi:MFS family permease